MDLQFKDTILNEVNERNGILCNQIGKLTGYLHISKLSRLHLYAIYYDKETTISFVYLTNNIELASEQETLLYTNRWQVELICIWIKQHLKIKSFYTENAVTIKIYCAIISYYLVAIIEKDLMIKRSTYEVLQVLGISLLDKTSILELFYNAEKKLCQRTYF